MIVTELVCLDVLTNVPSAPLLLGKAREEKHATNNEVTGKQTTRGLFLLLLVLCTRDGFEQHKFQDRFQYRRGGWLPYLKRVTSKLRPE